MEVKGEIPEDRIEVVRAVVGRLHLDSGILGERWYGDEARHCLEQRGQEQQGYSQSQRAHGFTPEPWESREQDRRARPD